MRTIWILNSPNFRMTHTLTVSIRVSIKYAKHIHSSVFVFTNETITMICFILILIFAQGTIMITDEIALKWVNITNMEFPIVFFPSLTRIFMHTQLIRTASARNWQSQISNSECIALVLISYRFPCLWLGWQK